VDAGGKPQSGMKSAARRLSAANADRPKVEPGGNHVHGHPVI
jgi:hypothetical protein